MKFVLRPMWRGGKRVLEATVEIVRGAIQVAWSVAIAPLNALAALKPQPPAKPSASSQAMALAAVTRANAVGASAGDLVQALAVRQAARALLRGEKPGLVGGGMDELLAGLSRERLREVATAAPAAVLDLLTAPLASAQKRDTMLANLRNDLASGRMDWRHHAEPSSVEPAPAAAMPPPHMSGAGLLALLEARRRSRQPT